MREKETEEHQLVSSRTPSSGNLAHNPGMCPDWESNWQHLGLQARTQSTEVHQPGLSSSCSHIVSQKDRWTTYSPSLNPLPPLPFWVFFPLLSLSLHYLCFLNKVRQRRTNSNAMALTLSATILCTGVSPKWASFSCPLMKGHWS